MTAPAISGSPVDVLLGRLDGVRQSGRGWRSLCPSCGGKSQKVSIAEAENGAVLLHAFCGCSPAEVLGAIGLSLGDLFPERLTPDTPDGRRAARRALREASWLAALSAVVVEGMIVLLACRQTILGAPLSDEDLGRLTTAQTRLEDALGVLRGR